MKRIDTPSARDITAGGKTFKGFTKGDAIKRQEATHLSDDWCNNVQEEIAGVIESAGDTVNTGDTENYNQLDGAIGKKIEKHRGRTFNHVGEIIEHKGALSERYLAENRLLKCDGQTLSKADYPDLWKAVVDKYHYDKNSLWKLSLLQELRHVPKATKTEIHLPSTTFTYDYQRPKKVDYSVSGNFDDWSNINTVNASTRSNLICWNPYRNRLTYIQDATNTGATLVEVDPMNWDSEPTEFIISGIGTGVKTWRYLFYYQEIDGYVLYFDDGNKIKSYQIQRNKFVFPLFDDGSHGLTYSNSHHEKDAWFFSNGENINVFNGKHWYLNYSSVMPHYTNCYFSIRGVSHLVYLSDGFSILRSFNSRNTYSNKLQMSVFGSYLKDIRHYFLFSDIDNYITAFFDSNTWHIYLMVDGYGYTEEFRKDRILGMTQNDDAYFVYSANKTDRTTKIQAYSKKIRGVPLGTYIQT